jgi:hypothetical protein
VIPIVSLSVLPIDALLYNVVPQIPDELTLMFWPILRDHPCTSLVSALMNKARTFAN